MFRTRPDLHGLFVTAFAAVVLAAGSAACSRDVAAPDGAATPAHTLAVQASETPGSTYFPPPETQGGWRKNTDPEFIRSLGMDPDSVQAWLDYCVGVKYRSGCILIKNGWIIAEGYAQFVAQGTVYQLHSNSKAYTIALFGHLLQQGLVPGLTLDSKLYDPTWLPEGFPLSDPRKADITFRHTFFHSSGLIPERAEWPEAKTAWPANPNYVFETYTLGQDTLFPESAQLHFTPGAFRPNDSGYSSVGFNHLTFVFKRLTGMSAESYLKTSLIEPLGITSLKLRKTRGTKIWPTAHGVQMTARDYGRFIYLLMNRGNWNGTQIFASDYLDPWLTTSRCWNIRVNKDGFYDVAGVPPFPADMFHVPGSKLNFAFAVPSMDMIAIRLGNTDNSQAIGVEEAWLTRLFAAVLPAP